MIPNPILKVLSTLTTHRVQHLLMGGQACVLYGAAEFSRDTDLAILASPANLTRLDKALAWLRSKTSAKANGWTGIASLRWSAGTKARNFGRTT